MKITYDNPDCLFFFCDFSKFETKIYTSISVCVCVCIQYLFSITHEGLFTIF
jgi:hypothetical protein